MSNARTARECGDFGQCLVLIQRDEELAESIAWAKRELRQQWQRAAKLILAETDVVTVSRALELALFMDAKLDVSKVPAK